MKKFRSGSAFRIAKIERSRFNDVVAKNLYTCAPPTMSGSSRVFDEVDLIALTVFSTLTSHDFNMPIAAAARISCEVKRALDKSPDEEEVVIVHDWYGGVEGVAARDHKPRLGVGSTGMLMRNFINVKGFRELVRKRAEEEENTIGED